MSLAHGPAFTGDGAAALRALADDYDRRVALREQTYLGYRQIIEICVVRCVAPLFVLTVGTSVGALVPMRICAGQ